MDFNRMNIRNYLINIKYSSSICKYIITYLYAYHKVLWVVLDAWTSVTWTLKTSYIVYMYTILAFPETYNYNQNCLILGNTESQWL